MPETRAPHGRSTQGSVAEMRLNLGGETLVAGRRNGRIVVLRTVRAGKGEDVSRPDGRGGGAPPGSSARLRIGRAAGKRRAAGAPGAGERVPARADHSSRSASGEGSGRPGGGAMAGLEYSGEEGGCRHANAGVKTVGLSSLEAGGRARVVSEEW
eukprot:scaffold6361_cov132-Isochrysis_galbana.AAC.13